jgi:AcrR family transcriptional regulator
MAGAEPLAGGPTLAYAKRMTSRPTKRLSRKDWITAARALLAKDGPDCLKAEPLARHMKTTKGSFYWHFKDVPEFHARLLVQWESDALLAVQHVLEEDTPPAARLRSLAERIAAPEGAKAQAEERAIRAWAASYPPARETVERVDSARLTGLRALLGASGVPNPEMARILYASAIGLERLGDAAPQENTAAMGSLVDLILALR